MDTEDDMPPLGDLDRSIFYAFCTPIVRLAARRGLPLRTLKHLVAMAYYHETRRQGLTGPVAAERLDVSLRTITLLSRRLKDFLTVENQHGLPRKIEYLLWAEPVSLARLKQTMRAEPKEIEASVERLVAQGRVRRRPDGRLETTRQQFALADDDDEGARLDGLSHLLEAVADTAAARFFDRDPKAFARTYAVRVRPEDVHRLADHIYPTLRSMTQLMDEAAHDSENPVEMALTVTWAPHRMVDRAPGDS